MPSQEKLDGWKKRYWDLRAEHATQAERLKVAEAAVEAYETALRTGVLAYPPEPDPRLAASPTHPTTMIGRTRAGTRRANGGSVD